MRFLLVALLCALSYAQTEEGAISDLSFLLQENNYENVTCCSEPDMRCGLAEAGRMCIMSDVHPTTFQQCSALGEYLGKHYIQLHVNTGMCYGFDSCETDRIYQCSSEVITIAREWGIAEENNDSEGEDWNSYRRIINWSMVFVITVSVCSFMYIYKPPEKKEDPEILKTIRSSRIDMDPGAEFYDSEEESSTENKASDDRLEVTTPKAQDPGGKKVMNQITISSTQPLI